jgi:hypothetical protein
MAITGKRNKRISQLIKNDTFDLNEKSNVTLIKNNTYYDNLTIHTAKGVCYLKIFRYKGCPVLSRGGIVHHAEKLFFSPENLIYMNRDNVIDNIYEALCSSGRELKDGMKNATVYGHYVCIRDFVRWCDNTNKNVEFSGELTLEYVNSLISDLLQGKISESTVASRRAGVSLMLKHNHLHKASKLLPSINVKNTWNSSTLTDLEYVKIGKQLMHAFTIYNKHLIQNTSPIVCPHFNENKLKELGYSYNGIVKERANAKRRANPANGNWINNLSRHAIMLTYMFTGITPSALFNLKRKDIKEGFKKGVGNYYKLNAVKGRALYQRQISEIGFTKYAKTFFESWLRASEIILTIDGRKIGDDDPIFPHLSKSLTIRPWGRYSESPHLSVNKALLAYGYPKINASIYRKTRSDKLFRAINDTSVVARANNNSIKTTEKHYLFGAEETHQIRLASAFIVQHDFAKGKDKKLAICEHEIRFIDPLSAFKSKEELKFQDTPSGGCMRSNGNYKSKVEKGKSIHRKYNTKIDTCIDFWSCFDCPFYAIVVEVEQIHKLLSLNDSILERLEMNSINSLAGKDLGKALEKIEYILTKINMEYPKVYNEANELNKINSHPLWADSFSIEDTLGGKND